MTESIKTYVGSTELSLKALNGYVDSIQCIEFETGYPPISVPIEAYDLFPQIKTSYQLRNQDQILMASSSFFNLLHRSFTQKRADPLTPIKLIYLSAHDTTISAYMSGINSTRVYQHPFASQLVIELFEDRGKFYVTWELNSERENLRD